MLENVAGLPGKLMTSVTYAIIPSMSWVSRKFWAWCFDNRTRTCFLPSESLQSTEQAGELKYTITRLGLLSSGKFFKIGLAIKIPGSFFW